MNTDQSDDSGHKEENFHKKHSSNDAQNPDISPQDDVFTYPSKKTLMYPKMTLEPTAKQMQNEQSGVNGISADFYQEYHNQEPGAIRVAPDEIKSRDVRVTNVYSGGMQFDAKLPDSKKSPSIKDEGAESED